MKVRIYGRRGPPLAVSADEGNTGAYTSGGLKMANQNETATTNEKVIAVLNGLIETCKNAEEGFRTAAEGVTDQSVKTAFAKFSRERWGMARELQDEVQGLGGNPET